MLTYEALDVPAAEMAVEMNTKERSLRPLYYDHNPVANLRLSMAYDRGVRAATRFFVCALLWIISLVALIILGTHAGHAQNSVPPFRTSGMNATLYVGQGSYPSIQSAVTSACGKGTAMRVSIPAGTVPTDTLSAVTGCSLVFIEDQRNGASQMFGWNGTAYTLISNSVSIAPSGAQYVVQPVVNGVQTALDATRLTVNGANPLGSVTASSRYQSFGDSITCGYIAAGHVAPYSAGEDCHTTTAYPSLIAAQTGVALSNYSIPADMACDVWPRQIAPNSVSPAASGSPLATLMIGTNDAATKGVGAYEANFIRCHQAVLAYMTIPLENKVAASSATIVSGSWLQSSSSSIGGYALSSTPGSVLRFTISSFGGPLYLWHTINDAVAPSSTSGTFTYAVDGGAAVSVLTQAIPAMATINGTTNSVSAVRVPPVPAGTHTVTITSISGTVAIVAVGTPPLNQYFQHPVLGVGDVPYVSGVAAGPVTQYTADALANIRLMQGDGLDVRYCSNHAYMLGTPAEEQSDLVHPTALGATHYAQAFLQCMQPATAATAGMPPGTPVGAVASAAGTGATVSLPASSAYVSTNAHFIVAVNTGTSPTAGVLFTAQFPNTAGYANGIIPACMAFPYTANAAPLATAIYMQQNAGTASANANTSFDTTTALAPNTGYAWSVFCSY